MKTLPVSQLCPKTRAFRLNPVPEVGELDRIEERSRIYDLAVSHLLYTRNTCSGTAFRRGPFPGHRTEQLLCRHLHTARARLEQGDWKDAH